MTFDAVENRHSVEVPAELSAGNEATKVSAWVDHAVREIQAGRDAEVQFGLLFKHFVPRCRSLIRSLDSQIDVDEVVREVMWRVYRGIGNFKLECSFQTWLITIVKNVVRSSRRNRTTEKAKTVGASLDALLQNRDGDGMAAGMPEPRSSDPDPLEATLIAEREARLQSLLGELPQKMRQSMLLYYVHGYKQSEIAALQGTTVNTVKKQLVSGRKRMRPAFSDLVELFSLLLILLMS